jgi:DNA-binding XRE family transcriptional regulator
MPAIIQFLGYNPLPPSNGWADRLVLCRLAMGLSQKESARRIGVDQGTLAVWERGEREPNGAGTALPHCRGIGLVASCRPNCIVAMVRP